MKKVALITCYFQPNYGSMLQAYATQLKLDELNIDNETINIEGFRKEIKKKKLRYFARNVLSKDVVQDKLGYIKLKIAKAINKELRENLKTRNIQFQEFSRKMFRISKVYNGIDELHDEAHRYQAFVVGSDQLWLPTNIEADYYTLSFVPEDIKKISYATSFGVSLLPVRQSKEAKKFLPRFDYLSVREQSGKELVYKLIGQLPDVVCDPTLLLTKDEWLKAIPSKQVIDGNYIFCYFLGENPYPREVAKRIKKMTNCKIIALQHIDSYIKSDAGFADEFPYNIGPSEFVNLIRNAKYVCTDSFHGTVFSIINEKSFFTFRRFYKKSKMSTNSRIDSLIDIVGLNDRLIENEQWTESLLDNSIDYVNISNKLDSFRSKSIEFLKKSIEA